MRTLQDFVHDLSVEQLCELYEYLCDYDICNAKELFWSHMMGEVEERRDEMMDSVL